MTVEEYIDMLRQYPGDMRVLIGVNGQWCRDVHFLPAVESVVKYTSELGTVKYRISYPGQTAYELADKTEKALVL